MLNMATIFSPYSTSSIRVIHSQLLLGENVININIQIDSIRYSLFVFEDFLNNDVESLQVPTENERRIYLKLITTFMHGR